MNSLETARHCALAADEKKGEEILVLDLRQVSSVADFFVIISGSSEPHLKAIRTEIETRLKSEGVRARAVDGFPHSHWVVMDYVDVLVHILDKETREFYSLERLWGDAPHVEWRQPQGFSS